MLAINMVTNKLFSKFLSLAFYTVLANNTTDDLGKISYQAVIGDIGHINSICSSYTW